MERTVTYHDDLAIVVSLALETEDRDRKEQAALLRVAHKLDRERNANVVTNRRYQDGGTIDAVLLVEPSRLAVEAGCDKPDCRICTKELVRS